LRTSPNSDSAYGGGHTLDVAISLSHHMNKTIDQAIETMGSPDVETMVNEKRVHEFWGSWSQHVMSWTRKLLIGAGS
jgi:hypothetical protein